MFKLCFTDSWDSFEAAQLGNWQVVQLAISHQEGHVAKACLVVGNFSQPTAPYLGIFDENGLLFQGVISGQFEHEQRLTKITVLGISPNFEADLQALLGEQSLNYNPAFFQQSAPKPSDYLESGNAMFYWDRTTGKISLSDYFKGNRCIDVSGKYLQDTFKMRQIAMPLGQVVAKLKVQWTQRLDGMFNAAPYIAKAFPEKMITTLNPEVLLNHWPRDAQRLGLGRRQSGYRIEQAKIRIIPAQGLPEYTQAITTKIGGEPKQFRAKIHYCKALLKINWHYHQPRVEEMVIQGQLNHCQYQITKHRIRKIPFAIELPFSEQAMFFETAQGREFINYASCIVQSQLRASARCVQVICTLPWNLGRDLTLDDSLKAEGKFSGKITKLRHVVKGTQRFVEVSVGCVIKCGDLTDAPYISDCDYGEEPWDDNLHSNDVLHGIIATSLFPKDLLSKIVVKNSATEQEAHLVQNQYPVRDNLHAVLQEVPTSIHLTLRDLRTHKPQLRRFERTLPVVVVV